MTVHTRKKLDDWMSLLVNNTFNWLTVIDIEQNIINGKKCGYLAVCRCKCGSICKYPANGVYNRKFYSCGCYRQSDDFIKSQHQWQKDHNKLKSSSDKNKQFYIDHPEMRVQISEKNKQYWESHRDIVEQRALSHKKYYEDHPEARKHLSDRIKQNYIDNPNLSNQISASLKQFYRNNPDKAREISLKYLQWYKSNPDKVAEMHKKQHMWLSDKDRLCEASKKRSTTLKNNPKIQISISSKFRLWAKNHRARLIEIAKKRSYSYTAKRSNVDFSCLISAIAPHQQQDLLSGNLKSTDLVCTKCPVCGQYDSHRLHNVFVFCRNEFKYDNLPLCRSCRCCLTSSKSEQHIEDFISTFCDDKPLRNSREIIPPLELDLYYPNHKIAIEFNGSYWHSSLFRQRDYHINKFTRCREDGILLVSIFEYDWLNNQEAIKSYLNDLFSGKDNAISFDSDLMNNNYPSPNHLYSAYGYIESSYSYRDEVVYTCGYSHIGVSHYE